MPNNNLKFSQEYSDPLEVSKSRKSNLLKHVSTSFNSLKRFKIVNIGLIIFVILLGMWVYRYYSISITKDNQVNTISNAIPNTPAENTFPLENEQVTKRSGVKSYIKDENGNYRLLTIDGIVSDITDSSIILNAGAEAFELSFAQFPITRVSFLQDYLSSLQESTLESIKIGDFVSYTVSAQSLVIVGDINAK